MPDIFNLSDTWNSGVTVFYGIKMNVGDTAHANGSRLLELQRNGVSQFAVDPQNGATVGTPASGMMGPGSINVQALFINGVALAGNFQPLDADLTSIAAASLTGKMYYRKADGVWAPVNVSTGLNFDPSSGDLIATAIPGMGNVISSGTPVNGQLALWLTSNAIKGIDIGSGLSLVGGTTLTATGAVAITGTPVNGQIAQWTDGTHIQGVPLSAITSAVSIGDAAPASPSVGQLWWESDTGALLLRYQDADSTQWVAVNGQAQVVSSTGIPEAPVDGTIYGRKDAGWVAAGGGGASISIADTPPASPTAGAMWWESDTGILWIYYNDGTSSQWVAISAAPSTPASTKDLLAVYSPAGTSSFVVPPSVLSSAYDQFEIAFSIFNNSGSNSAPCFHFSSDGGSTFVSGASSYVFAGTYASSGGAAPANSGGSSTFFQVTMGQDPRLDLPCTGVVKLLRPNVSGVFTQVMFQGTSFAAASGMATLNGCALCQGTTNIVNALKIAVGNPAAPAGPFGANSWVKVYGLK